MNVLEAINTRRSTRAFTDQQVSGELIRKLIDQARRAPSGGNLQPWKLYVFGGDKLKTLVSTVSAKIVADPKAALVGEGAEYHIYPPEMQDPYKARSIGVGGQLYEALQIPRDDRAGRMRQFARNFEFFGAPVGIIVTIDRTMQQGQFADLGLYMQSFALLAVENGLATCMQEAWANWHKTIREFGGVPDNEMVFCGISVGYPDTEKPVNQFVSARAEVQEFAHFLGI